MSERIKEVEQGMTGLQMDHGQFRARDRVRELTTFIVPMNTVAMRIAEQKGAGLRCKKGPDDYSPALVILRMRRFCLV